MAQSIRSLQAEVKKLKEDLEKATKDYNNEKASRESWSARYTSLQEELEQIHGLLDNMEGAGGRKTEHEDSWSRQERKVMTRLASWLAYKVNRGNS
jgi:chromosome segregation ATPase